MENASKALIIAGSILVSIVIISLGVMIVSNVSSTIESQGDLSEQEIATYNQPFQAYEGTKSGTQVRALLDKVRTHNLSNPDDESRHIMVQDSDATEVSAAPTELVTAATVNTLKATIKAGKTYTVTLGYDANSGLVVAVGIVEKK